MGCAGDSWWKWLTLIAWTFAGVYLASAFRWCALLFGRISDLLKPITIVLQLLCAAGNDRDVCKAADMADLLGSGFSLARKLATVATLGAIEGTAAGLIEGMDISPSDYRYSPGLAVGTMLNASGRAVSEMASWNNKAADMIGAAEDYYQWIETAEGALGESHR
jgi:hypothetical protein